MAFQKGHKLSVGNKGGTGRPSLVVDKVRAAVINKSWEKCLKWIEKKDKRIKPLTPEQEFDLIKTVISKSIPKDININSTDINNFLNELYAIKREKQKTSSR